MVGGFRLSLHPDTTPRSRGEIREARNVSMTDHVYSEGTPFADEIHRDVASIHEFGSEHPGVLVDLKLSHDPTTHLVVLLTAGTHSDSISTLKDRLAHGEHFEVEFTSVTSEQLQKVREEIQELASERGPQAFRQYGVQWGQVHIILRSDQLQLAEELSQRYGDMVRIEVGLKPYPPQPGLARVEHPQSTQPARPEISIPGLIATLLLDQPSIATGSDGGARVRFENGGDELITIWTGSPLTARLTDPVSKRIVGFFDGAIGGVGVTLRLAPGDVETLPAIIGTTSPADEEGYSVPPGRYLVEAVVPVYGGPGENGVPSVSVLRVGTEVIVVTET